MYGEPTLVRKRVSFWDYSSIGKDFYSTIQEKKIECGYCKFSFCSYYMKARLSQSISVSIKMISFIFFLFSNGSNVNTSVISGISAEKFLQTIRK